MPIVWLISTRSLLGVGFMSKSLNFFRLRGFMPKSFNFWAHQFSEPGLVSAPKLTDLYHGPSMST